MVPIGDPLETFSPDLFRGRTALVTGGGRGIGRRTALSFARFGADGVIAGRHAENLESTRQEVEALGVKCLAQPTNIRDLEQVEALVEASVERFESIDYLINNAGGQFPARPTEISDRGWRAVVDLNLNGTWNMCNRVGKHMLERGRGAIVNVVHIYSFDRGAPPFAHSGAARAGVVSLTRTLAYHWARQGLNINALAPGMGATRSLREEEFAHTEQDDYESIALQDIPVHRLAEPEEVAAIILFLCSPAARFINGAALIADGAQYLGAWTDWFDPEVV